MDIIKFITYLQKEKKTSTNTCDAYTRDLTAFQAYLLERGVPDADKAGGADVAAYMMALKNEGRSKATVNRKLSSIRSYYKYLQRQGTIKENPAETIKTPRIEKKQLKYLTIEEVERLLETPDDSVKGIRDKAILEVMYATGIRVSELIELKVKDVNFRMGFVTCNGEHGRARIVPMGVIARRALDEYMLKSRVVFMEGKDEKNPDGPLFVNYQGEAFTRQGLWKILKKYGELSGLDGKLTPHILRTSFGVHMVQNGADLKSLQELMGNEDIMAMEIFLSVTKNRIKDVYDRTHPRA